MSNKDKHNGNGNTAATAGTPPADKPVVTKDKLKQLYAECLKFDVELKAVEARRSVAIKALLDAGGAGPYTVDGELKTIAKMRNDAGYYFRGKNTSDAISLD
jgi:hypothetical protein